MLDAVVIGAGISGLATAYFLQQAGLQVKLVGERLGGVIQTRQEEGFLYELGPNTFPSSSKSLMELSRSLGLTPKAASDKAKKRYLFYKNQLQALPGNPLEIFTTPLLSLSGKARLFSEPLKPKVKNADPTVAEFVTARLGAEVLERFVDPFVSGIYAGDVQKLSMAAVFPKLSAWERQAGSILKGAVQAKKKAPKTLKKSPYQLLSFQEGMATLPSALASALADHVSVGCATKLLQTGEGWEVLLQDGERLQAQSVVLATPAYVASYLLRPRDLQAAKVLDTIEYAPIATVAMGFEKPAMGHPLDGFGCLIPRSQQIPLLGAIWSSSLFPERAPEGRVLLSCFIGGATLPAMVEWGETQISEEVLSGLRAVFHQPGLQPIFSRVQRWERAIPQYTLGHRERVQALEDRLSHLPGLFLAGNYLHGVSMNDCVSNARQAADGVTRFVGQQNLQSV